MSKQWVKANAMCNIRYLRNPSVRLGKPRMPPPLRRSGGLMFIIARREDQGPPLRVQIFYLCVKLGQRTVGTPVPTRCKSYAFPHSTHGGSSHRPSANLLRCAGSLPLRLQLFKEFADALEGLLDVREGVAIGCADKSLARVAEGVAGDDCDLLRVEESFAKFLTCKAG